MEGLFSGIRSSPSTSLDGGRRTLNDPRLFESTPLTEPLDGVLQEHVAAEARPRREAPLGAEFARRLHSFDALNQFVAGGQWRALALAAEASILESPAGQERMLLKLWMYRTLALTSLRHYVAADRELGRLEVASRNAEVCRKSVRSPTVVWPFELRLLRARMPGLAHGDWHLAADRISALARGCRRRLATATESNVDRAELDSQRLFRLGLLLVGCFVRMGDPEQATFILGRELLASGGAGNDPLLLSAAARLHLQLGAVAEAERLFLCVEQTAAKNDRLVLMNRGLYAAASGKWETARDMFVAAGAGQPERIAAANNAAVCELYLGSPQAMLRGLDQLMTASPAAAGASEELVFNYCTGLDLLHDGVKLRDAKATKIIDVAMWAGDGFDPASFKL
ncbi:hypothetical protein GGF46_000180 [Coemansia sp. RSA 552]|nr:hypothetical protein GGF46_000180 [Coemansia sp. RSA 552]